jgi:hypothetical protein
VLKESAARGISGNYVPCGEWILRKLSISM